MSDKYAGNVAVVTGGASGIGRAICADLARAGALVVVSDINVSGAESAAETIRVAGGKAEAIAADVTSFESMEALMSSVVKRHGRIDYLFNNAGMTLVGEVRDMSMDNWNRILDLNLRGVIHGVQAAYPLMVRQRSGHIVNVASGFGLVAAPIVAAYCATKYAVVALTKSLRAEGADLGVKVSVACPGFVQTPLYDNSPFLHTDWNTIRSMSPVRMLSAEESARIILRGVACNRALIAFPGYVHALYWIERFFPRLWAWIAVRVVRRFRAARK